MNWTQFGLFFIYILSMLSIGCAWRRRISKDAGPSLSLYVGESLLLGSIMIVGEMLTLSLLHLYSAFWLWLVMALNLIACKELKSLFKKKIRLDLPLGCFFGLLGIFIFRNCYFLMDVDSHSTYLFAQKLWLEHGSSIFASEALDAKIFVPHFNAVPYALGLSVFPSQTLFPQLVAAFWTIIALLLVFGYVSARFDRAYALAACMLVVFNDHMFFSGANASVIINSALVALVFAAAYNIWEGRTAPNTWRLVLAFVFLVQFVANKYPFAYVMLAMMTLGILLHDDKKGLFKEVLRNRIWAWSLLLSIAICGLWFVKNYLAVGCPTFPVLASQMGIMHWTKEMTDVFNKVYVGPLSFPMILKYFTYLFIWPGINAAKIVITVIAFLPFILLCSSRRKDFNIKDLSQLTFWLSVCVLIIVGMCLVTFVDPRHYRYGIAVMAVAAVIGLDYVLHVCLKFPVKLTAVLLLVIAVQGWKIIFYEGGSAKYPSIKDNVAVISDRMHTADAAKIFYPDNIIVDKEWPLHTDLAQHAAWDVGVGGVTPLSAFLLPTRPQVGLWYTTAVHWDSYKDAQLIERDLSALGIDWIMTVKAGHLVFESKSEYAKRAVYFDLHPKELFYNYGFPEELSKIHP